MLLINDTPGVMVSKVEILPGAEVGSSDFDIETTPKNRIDGYTYSAGNKKLIYILCLWKPDLFYCAKYANRESIFTMCKI